INGIKGINRQIHLNVLKIINKRREGHRGREAGQNHDKQNPDRLARIRV
ncbi:3852_t:CDS:1, partial [Scutellospora calospora]